MQGGTLRIVDTRQGPYPVLRVLPDFRRVFLKVWGCVKRQEAKGKGQGAILFRKAQCFRNQTERFYEIISFYEIITFCILHPR